MEILDIKHLFGGIYKDKRVLVTGHTGFKGSWLIYWLHRMGAKVFGISLESNTSPNHFTLLDVKLQSIILDITQKQALENTIKKIDPEIIFHLAAQPLVRLSYEQPVDTFMTNIMGTVYVLDVCRNLDALKALVIVTSDKCYENMGWVYGYRA